jgi:transposase
MFSILHMHGVRAEGRIFSEVSLKREVEAMMKAAAAEYGSAIRKLVQPLLDLAIRLRRMVHEMDLDLRRTAISDPLCRRFMEIPGVGVLSALSFITAIGEPHRFHHPTDVGAFLGLTPRIWQTGHYRRRFGISKAGSRLTRKHLFSAAKAMLNSRQDTPFKLWALQLAERSNRRKATVALARKLAVLMLVMWRNDTSYERRPVVASLLTTGDSMTPEPVQK